MADKVTISSILKDSDKADFVAWVKDNIAKADRCVVLFGKRDGNGGGLILDGRQVGFDFDFELGGFIDMLPDQFRSTTDDDVDIWGNEEIA